VNKKCEANPVIKITKYKLQITNKIQTTNYKLQMQAAAFFRSKGPLLKSFCGGTGGSFFKKRPLAAGGKGSKFALILLIILAFSQAAQAETRTGFFLSLGHLHYTYKTFRGDTDANLLGEPSDLFFGVSLYLKNRFEISLVYNRSTEDFGSDPQTISYDKDGFGLEIGKVIHIHLFKKNNFDVSIEFIGGGYGILYPFKKINTGRNAAFFDNESSTPGEDDLFYQAGFYWSVRLTYLIAKKASINIGFKSLVPVRSNEFIETRGQEILLTKSFFIIGISF
jgi:hypothetical protein